METEIPKVINPEFFDLLNAKGILSEKDLRFFLSQFRENTLDALIFLVQKDSSKKNTLCRLWGDSLGFAYVDLEKTLFQPDVVKHIPEKFARRYKTIPIYKLGDSLTVATADPGNRLILEEVEKFIGCGLSPVFSFPHDIDDAIDIQYQTSTSLDELLRKLSLNPLFSEAQKITAEELEAFAGNQSVVDLTRSLLLFGVKERASDIHIEPSGESVRIRFRIDGVLHERMQLDQSIYPTLISRLKILAGADITERRRSQDGRINIPLLNKEIDLRFSSSPTIYGEKIVLRILGGVQAYDVPKLSELHFSKQISDRLKQVLASPNGVFFVTGPTGSGKTTTLYSAIRHINKTGINIMTIEDPVEYRLKGVNQIQANPAVGLDFAAALRSFLRQDPDVILVGEVRDAETARIASQAALTGHLVFTTLHTNSAIQAVVRLTEIGVEPYLVAPSIIGVMAQRLIRRLCEQCKESYPLSPDEIESIFIWDGKTPVSFYRHKGCPYCNYTGFSGRLAIHELFIVNSEVRSLIANNAPIMEIRKSAYQTNFRPMRHDGIKKVLRGLTTIEEVNRVTMSTEELVF